MTNMKRVANFTAGPAGLPTAVLERVQAELLDFAGSGMSIMENSHRSKLYDVVHNEAIALLRELLDIPADYDVLFLQGGASQQFAMVPMNFLHAGQSADYVLTGHWSERALEEGKVAGTVRVAASTEKAGFHRVPAQAELELDPHAAYVHITDNNTIEGTEYGYVPNTGDIPLITDASSNFLSKKTDISRYGMIYAGAQKNLGPSGIVIVVVKKSLVAGARKDIPVVFRYATAAANNSLFNTPPTFAIYLVHHVLQWVKEQGGLAQIAAWNRDKAARLYAAIDAHPDYYRCPIEHASRSAMNVVYRLPTTALDDKFVQEATAAGLVGLKGYRTVGGIRASIYNAVTVEQVKTLCDFMGEFARNNPA